MMDQGVFKADINLCTKPRLKLLKSALGLIFTPWLLQRAGELFFFAQEIAAEGRIIRLPDTNSIFHIVTHLYVAG